MALAIHKTLRAFHLASATLVVLFVLVHLSNHSIGLAGQREHVAFMHAVRPLYRNAFVEPVLLLLFATQILTGLTMVVRGWRSRRGTVSWLQAGSGLYLASFVALHVFAVLSGRVLLGLDTDFRFAAAGFHVSGWPWYFWPYYTLAVLTLFAHLGCAFYWNTLDRSPQIARIVLMGFVATGAVAGLLISSSMAGLLHPVEIPAAYKATY